MTTKNKQLYRNTNFPPTVSALRELERTHFLDEQCCQFILGDEYLFALSPQAALFPKFFL